MIEDPLPVSEAATTLGNQGLRKGQILTAVGEDLNKFFTKKGLTAPSLQFCNPDAYTPETTLAACNLIFGGTLYRMPKLAVVLVHGEGFFPYQVGRFDHGHRAQPEPGSRGAGPASWYTCRFYYDTLTHSPQSLCFLCDIVGADRLLLGSNHPFGLGHPEPVRALRDAKLGGAAESAALESNAAKLFWLEA